MSGAAAAIRAGKLAAHTGKDRAGLRPYSVIMVLTIEASKGKPFIGSQAVQTQQRLIISPRPELILKRSETQRQFGASLISDAVMVGAFPKTLAGSTVQYNPVTSETQNQGIIFKTYTDPDSFIKDLSEASYFLVNGERFQFSATTEGNGGAINVDKYQSEWTVKLMRSSKQN